MQSWINEIEIRIESQSILFSVHCLIGWINHEFVCFKLWIGYIVYAFEYHSHFENLIKIVRPNGLRGKQPIYEFFWCYYDFCCDCQNNNTHKHTAEIHKTNKRKNYDREFWHSTAFVRTSAPQNWFQSKYFIDEYWLNLSSWIRLYFAFIVESQWNVAFIATFLWNYYGKFMKSLKFYWYFQLKI